LRRRAHAPRRRGMNGAQQTFAFGVVPPSAPQRRNVVIEAGAGTGKTTAIVAEVLKLLLGDAPLAPERIVLMTFTEKAAGEIADRIHQALSEIACGTGSQPVQADGRVENPTHIWPAGSPHPLLEITPTMQAAAGTQLARIDQLRSQTIHSFCQMIL